MKVKYIKCLGESITCYESGNKTNPALLFIHGNSAHAVFFNPLIQLLELKYHIVTLDLPGHRQSGCWKKDEFTRENFATLFNTVLDHFNITEADVLGFSMGGLILLECFDLIPAIRKIAIVGHPPLKSLAAMTEAYYLNEDSSLYLKGPLSDDEAERVYNAVIGINDEQIKNELKRALLGTNPLFREGCLRLAQNVSDQIAKLNQLQQSIAIVHATDDKAVQFSYLEKLKINSLWENRIQLIDGSGHHAIIEKPAELALILDRYFGSAD